MAAHFSRKLYDDCYTDEKTKMSIGGIQYQMFPGGYENRDRCLPNHGPRPSMRGAVRTGELPFRTAMESYLHNLDIPDSRCMPQNLLVEKRKRIKTFLETNKQYQTPALACTYNNLDENPTRMTADNDAVRTFQYPRFEFPMFENSKMVFYGIGGSEQVFNNRHGVNTRIQLKDSLRPQKK